MRIIFENIDPKRNGEKIMIDPATQGQLEARAMIAAYINSGNLNPNGAKQDFVFIGQSIDGVLLYQLFVALKDMLDENH